MPKASGTRARVVVFTQGAESTLVASEGVVHEFNVEALPKEQLVDTNGELSKWFALFSYTYLSPAITLLCAFYSPLVGETETSWCDCRPPLVCSPAVS